MYKVFMLMVLAVVGLVVPASAADYWLPGDWNGWATNVDQMTDNGDGTFSATLTGFDADSFHEFKFYEAEMEVWFYPPDGLGNSWFYADGDGAVTIGFNTNVVDDGWLSAQYRIGESTDPGTWTVAGSFGGAGLPDWDNAGAGMSMTAQGGGIYLLSLDLPLGGGPDWIGDPSFNTYAWKSVVTGSWASIGEDVRSLNTGNCYVTVSEGYQTAKFYVDAYTGVAKSEVVPEPTTIALLGLGGLALIRRKR